MDRQNYEVSSLLNNALAHGQAQVQSHIPSNLKKFQKFTKIITLPKCYGRFYIKLLFHFAYEAVILNPFFCECTKEPTQK